MALSQNLVTSAVKVGLGGIVWIQGSYLPKGNDTDLGQKVDICTLT